MVDGQRWAVKYDILIQTDSPLRGAIYSDSCVVIA